MGVTVLRVGRAVEPSRRGDALEWVGIYPPLLNEAPPGGGGGARPAPSLTILIAKPVQEGAGERSVPQHQL